MRGISSWQWFLALFSGLLQVLIFPSPNLFALCWIALVPLFLAILRPEGFRPALVAPDGRRAFTTLPQGFFLGYCSGIVWYAGSCFWVFHVMHWYGGLSTAAAFGVQILFCLYLSLYNGLFGALLAAASRRSLRAALLLSPFLWVAVELARARVTSFPWDLLGDSQTDNIPLTRIAVVTGVYGISFVIALVNSGITATLLTPAHARRRYLPMALAIALMLQLGIFARPLALPAPHQALLVQQNIPMDQEWTQLSLAKTVVDLAQISTPPAGDPRMVVWPESPAPFYSNDAVFHSALSQLARAQNSYIIVTLVGALPPQPPATQPSYTNRAELVAPSGLWSGYYDKIHLVPFGEYVPWQSIFAFASGLTQQVGDFVPGKLRNLFTIAGHKYATFICYEAVFPDEVRQFAAQGAEVFVNVSDDGWYGKFGAPGQHLNMARMRAIENHRWLLRSTNTGITASIDPLGRVVARAPANERTTLVAPYDYISQTTFYSRHGDWFAWACVVISILGVTIRLHMRGAVLAPGSRPSTFEPPS